MPARPRRSDTSVDLVFEAESRKTLVELGQLSATVEQAMYAGPGRVCFRVNVQLDGITGAAPRGAGRVGAAVSHLNGDFMVVWMRIFLHCLCS